MKSCDLSPYPVANPVIVSGFPQKMALFLASGHKSGHRVRIDTKNLPAFA